MYIYSDYVITGGIFIVAVFSLAWFVVGVHAGKLISSTQKRSRGKGGRKQGSKGSAIEIYVGNLSYDVSEKDLKKAFQRFGKIKSARLIINKYNNKSKGYGFVEMINRPEANAAIEAMDNCEFKGRRVVVNEAKSNNRNNNRRR